MGRPAILLLAFLLHPGAAVNVFAQSAPETPPILVYTLHIDTADLFGYWVSLHIYHAPHQFHLAMATHHEYDDRFWRYIASFEANDPADVFHDDSAIWTIRTPNDQVTLSYRIQLPPPTPVHFSQRPFLNRNGGLVGDLHSFLYLVEYPQAACRLNVQLPAGWQSAAGLDPAGNPPRSDEFVATTPQLLDGPILVGHLHRWTFIADSIPHEVVYLPSTPTLIFDSTALLSNIKKIVRTTAAIFGGYPYRHYSFLFEDSTVGALEHGNSVTIGIPASTLKSARPDIYEEIAHEYFHSWNLMAIRPAGYTELNYGPQQQSPGLWFSEGVTMLYADLICRRTGLPVEDQTRLTHLTALLTRYYSDTGNTVIPPSKVSLASNLQPGPLGDYDASTHLQGELLGFCLDMLIRDATDGRRSIDDLLKEVYQQFGGHRPLHDSDIEAAVTNICECTAARPFFQKYLVEGNPIDFSPWLDRIALRMQHDQPPATDPGGQPLPDTRVYSWTRRDDTSLRIGITNPNSCWALAGLHTGDIISAFNGSPIITRQDFQTALNTLHIGDAITITIRNGAATTPHTVRISGYTRPLIQLKPSLQPTPKQIRLQHQWLSIRTAATAPGSPTPPARPAR